MRDEVIPHEGTPPGALRGLQAVQCSIGHEGCVWAAGCLASYEKGTCPHRPLLQRATTSLPSSVQQTLLQTKPSLQLCCLALAARATAERGHTTLSAITACQVEPRLAKSQLQASAPRLCCSAPLNCSRVVVDVGVEAKGWHGIKQLQCLARLTGLGTSLQQAG